ncbi:MAG TPA: acyl-ACP--UDP-N-acetylglucosamine O-acyltransferase [Candidatus Acidoferrales bacterium]|jgi:UDP-N-acetylglucosamine acyltransferase|nr:acyl-ACP--UDP-N-acetylglucosamine O-acyltransferase [Candidatus Acidoferrales bacterium]
MIGIDRNAVVSPRARIGEGTRIGAFAVVGDDVELGENCLLDAHALVQGPAKLGRENHLYSFCVVGGDPQDLTYAGERTRLEVGDGNQFREFCTVHRGTAKGGGVTRIGSHTLIMAYAHVAHDCVIGDHAILVNGAALAGHVTIGEYATVGPDCAVHQFCRVGRYAYIAGFTPCSMDVPPFSKIVAPRETRCYGVNTIGLERQGFSPERISEIESAFRLLLRSKLNTSQAVEKMRETLAASPDVLELVGFIESTERGVIK